VPDALDDERTERGRRVRDLHCGREESHGFCHPAAAAVMHHQDWFPLPRLSAGGAEDLNAHARIDHVVERRAACAKGHCGAADVFCLQR
jgi:hypothetical protein